MQLPASPSARMIALQRYRLQTMTVHQNILLFVRSGQKTLENAATRIIAGPGTGILVAQGTTWNVTNDPAGDHHYEALCLSLGGASHSTAPARPAGVPLIRTARTFAVDALLQETVERTFLADLPDFLLSHRIQEVILILGARGLYLPPPRALDWASRVRALITQSPGENWTAETVAQTFHLSESTLRRRLAASSTTLAALIRETRLETALLLLQTSPHPVGEIARQCGWQSHSRFSAAFFSRWGVTPSSIRGESAS